MLKNNMEKFFRKEILAPIIIILVGFFLCVLAKKIVRRIFKFKTIKINDGKKKTIVNLVSNIVIIVIVIICILTILEIYGIDTKSLVASFGVVGLVAGLALQDILKDFIVGIEIIFEGQFSIGDWVCINGFKGEVLPSNLRTTKLKSYTGEIKFISNKEITEVINYSLCHTNLIIDIGVAYESNIDNVRKVLDKMCIELKEEYKFSDFNCLGIEELADSSIKFRLVATSRYTERLQLEREIRKSIVHTFKKNNISIPYNQVVVHNGQRV